MRPSHRLSTQIPTLRSADIFWKYEKNRADSGHTGATAPGGNQLRAAVEWDKRSYITLEDPVGRFTYPREGNVQPAPGDGQRL